MLLSSTGQAIRRLFVASAFADMGLSGIAAAQETREVGSDSNFDLRGRRLLRMILMIVLLSAALTCMGTAIAAPMMGSGPGCKDKAIAAKLLGRQDTDPAYIEIWARGMQDRSCRGYGAGQEVTVEDRADGMACVRAENDKACFWVRESMAPRR